MKKTQTIFAPQNAHLTLPFGLTAHARALLKTLEKTDSAAFEALKKQWIPAPEENRTETGELSDPLGEHLHTAVPRLIHQYKNRCLLLSTDKCLAYCRYCFRREYLAKKTDGFITETELEKVCAYLNSHTEVTEVLISGGDVLSGSNEQVFALLERLRAVRPQLLLRLCTRANVFMPERFTRQLIAVLKKTRPLWVIPHVNHPAELTKKTRASLRRLIDAGIPVQSQSVLLRGVNDSVAILAELFTELVQLGVKPGYLFQADFARGTAHFRVPAEEGIRLYAALRTELSGLSLPVYAVDLPDGGGKFNMLELDPQALEQKVIRADTLYMVEKNGKTWKYPRG